MAGHPAGDFHGVGEGRGARGRDTAMCGTSPDRDHEDSGDDDDDDVDGDDEHGTQAMQATPTGQLSYCIFHPQGPPTIRRLLVAQLITFVILVFFAQALLSGSQ